METAVPEEGAAHVPPEQVLARQHGHTLRRILCVDDSRRVPLQKLADVRKPLQVLDPNTWEKDPIDETLQKRGHVPPPARRENHEVLAPADGVTSLDEIRLERLRRLETAMENRGALLARAYAARLRSSPR
jgi:hypothetical protein